MNKYFFFFFSALLFSGIDLDAQKFGDGNPVWNYSVYSGWGGLTYHLQMSVAKDTIFQGKQCKILQNDIGLFHSYMPYKNMICQDSAKVVFWSSSLSTFQTLYDFDAVIGDSWTLKLDDYTLYTNDGIWFMKTDSVYYDTINNVRFKVQVVKNHSDTIRNEFDGTSLTVYENIGCTQFLFPWDWRGLDDDFIDYLRCFADDSIGIYRFDHSVACDYTQVGIDQLNEAANFSVFPNPSKGLFYLEGITADITAISIVDLAGNSVGFTCDLNSENEPKTVELQKVQRGIYFVEITTKDDQIIRRKVVVQ